MRKIFLRLTSCALSGAVMLNMMSVQAYTKNRKKNNGLSTTSKVVIGLSVSALALTGGGVLLYKLFGGDVGGDESETGSVSTSGGDSSTPTSSSSDNNTKSKPGETPGNTEGNQRYAVINANLTNTRNLCYWHSFIQQMYSLRAFRSFINEVNTEVMDPDTATKILAFREFFNEMRNKQTINQNDCLIFAQKILPAEEIGRQNDIHEILVQFIGDIKDIYDRFCIEKYGRDSNIFGSVLKLERENFGLQDLLIPQEGYNDEKQAVMRDLLSNEQQKQIIYKSYLFEYCGIGNLLAVGALNLDGIARICYGRLDSALLNSIFTENLMNTLSGGHKINLNRLKEAVRGNISVEFLNDIINSNGVSQLPIIKNVINEVYMGHQINVPVVEDQFVLFVNRNLAPGIKNTRPVEFGNGVVNYGGTNYGLTAVSVHHGTGNGGHYYTYKRECDGNWYCYNDLSSSVNLVSWDDVKRDAQTNCTMFTFTRFDKIIIPAAIRTSETPKTVDSNEIKSTDENHETPIAEKPMELNGPNETNATPQTPVPPSGDSQIHSVKILFHKQEPVINPGIKFDNVPTNGLDIEIVESGKNKGYSGITDEKLLREISQQGRVAIIDAANRGALGGGGVDGAIFGAMGPQIAPDWIKNNVPEYEGSKDRIHDGGAILHSSFGIAQKHPNVPFVIQAVSPQLNNPNDLPLLYSAYYNAVRLGLEYGCNTLITAALGMGVFCHNHNPDFGEQCALVAAQAIDKAQKDCNKRVKVIFTDHNDGGRTPATNAFFQKLREFGAQCIQ